MSRTVDELDLLVAANQVAFVRIAAEDAVNRFGQWNCDYNEWMTEAVKHYEEARGRLASLPPHNGKKGETE